MSEIHHIQGSQTHILTHLHDWYSKKQLFISLCKTYGSCLKAEVDGSYHHVVESHCIYLQSTWVKT